MAKTTQSLTKAAIGAATAGAMLMSATPAAARDHRDRDGISAGEIIAGAVVIGGLAAILSSGSNDRYDRYDRRHYNDARYGYGYDYNRYGGSRSAVNQCVNAAQRSGSRYGRISVTDVTSIDRKRDGYKIKGRVVAQDRYRGGRGYYDNGKFTCDVRYGRVDNVKFSGLR